MPPIFWKSKILSFGSGPNGNYPSISGTTVAIGGNYVNATVPSGATFVIPRSVNITFSGTLTNNGTITGGPADAPGTGSAYELTSLNDLLPISCNGASSTNYTSHLGGSALRIVARKFVNNGVVKSDGYQSTVTDSYGYSAGINGSGAGFIFIFSEEISGSSTTVTMNGGDGEAGHTTYSYITYNQGACTEQTYSWTWCGGGGPDCKESSDQPATLKLNHGSGTETVCPSPTAQTNYATAVPTGSNGPSSSAKIITATTPAGGTPVANAAVTTIISPFSAGSIIWFDKNNNSGIFFNKEFYYDERKLLSNCPTIYS